MEAKIVVLSLFVLLLMVRTSKCGGDTDTTNVTGEIGRNVRVDFMLTESDEDEDPEVVNMRRMLDRDENEVIVAWKMEKYESVPVDITDYSELVTDNAYVILQGKSNASPETWKIFYWVGDKSSEEDAVNAALFAYVLDSIVHPTVNFRREAEGQESPHFRALFEFSRMVKSPPEGTPKMAAEENPLLTDEQVGPMSDEHNTRMILIGGSTISTVKEVEFSLNYLEKEDVCLVAYNSQAMYVYCGRDVARDAQEDTAKKLARMIQQKTESTLLIFQVMKRSSDQSAEAHRLNEVVVEFKRISEAIANKKVSKRTEESESGEYSYRKVSPTGFFFAHSKAQCKPKNIFQKMGEICSGWNMKKPGGIGKKVDISVTRIYQDKHDAVREEIMERSPITLNQFEHNESYVLDTCLKDVGMVVWLGYVSEIDEREGAVRKAELLLRERIHQCGSRPIIFVDATDERIRSLRDTERYLYSYLANFVELMQEMQLTWEHFYELRELDGGDVVATSTNGSEDELGKGYLPSSSTEEDG